MDGPKGVNAVQRPAWITDAVALFVAGALATAYVALWAHGLGLLERRP